MFRSLLSSLTLVLLGSTPLLAAPVIHEVMAASQTSIADRDGDYPDWIEIHNPDAAPVDLTGWYLSDDVSKPTRWTFPALTIPPQGYVVVFCSNKNRAVSGSELHTNFVLNDGGETLQVTRPDGTVSQVLRYELQYAGLSFDGADYLSPPTPGASNATATVAIVRAPTFSVAHGFKKAAFDLRLSCTTPGATIHYTLNGNDPTTTSPRYTKPLRISKTTAIRAVAVVPGKQSSPILTRTYLFTQDMVKQSLNGKAPAGWPKSWGANHVDYGMDPRIATTGKFAKALPGALKAISTMAITIPLTDLFDATSGIYANPQFKGVDWERAASIELINPDGEPGFQINAGLRIRGGASRDTGNPKHSFRVLMKKEYGAESLHYPLFGPEGAAHTERFDLRCEQLVAWHYFVDPNADFIRDIYGRTIQGKLGQPHNRSHFYHLVINGQYWGMYQTEERVCGENGAAYFGGDKDDYDVVKVNYDADSVGGGTDFIDGSFGAWRRAVELGSQGFQNNANYFKIQGLNVDGSRNRKLEPLIDVDNLIDYMIAGIYIAADDSPPAFGTQNNWSAMRSRKGDFGFRFYAHDWEISMNDATGEDNRVGEQPTENPLLADGSMMDPTSANPWHFWQAMRANEEFRLRVADRVQKHFFNDGPLVQSRATALWRHFMDTIDQAIIGESARWGDARGAGGIFQFDALHLAKEKPLRIIPLKPGQDEDDMAFDAPNPAPIPKPNPDTGGKGKKAKPFTRDDWLKACNNHILNGFLADRTAHVLQHFREGNLSAPIQAPSMTPFGGVLPAATLITLTPPEVETLPPGVTVPAQIYYTTNGADPRLVGGAISKSASIYTAPFSLAKNSTVKVRAYYQGQWSALVETTFEVSSSYSQLRITEIHYNPPAPALDSGEFVELTNMGTTSLDLSGVAIREGIEYLFPAGTTLAAGARIVVARDPAAFASLYGFTPAGPYTGRLSNDGETLTLLSPLGGRITSLVYKDSAPWPTAPDGYGHSLVYSGQGDSDKGANWFASAALGGSPGQPEITPTVPLPVIISEVIHDSGGTSIELQNLSAEAQHLDTWKLRAGASSVTLTNDHNIPAQGRLLLRLTDLSGLTLTSTGGALALQRPPSAALTRDAVHLFRHGPLLSPVSYGRLLTSEGREFFPTQSASSPGLIEAGPALSDLRIVEIHYQPKQQVMMGSNIPAISEFEFIEVQNRGTSPLDISGYRMAGVTYVFPEGSIIPADGLALICMNDPAAFRSRYEIAESVPIYGPAIGTLDPDGDRVGIEAPVSIGGLPAFAVIEEVRYDDSSPWPAEAAGRGHSLQRYRTPNFAGEVASWGSASPSPGKLNVVNAPPASILIALPKTLAGTTLSFQATGTDLDGHITKIEFIEDGSVIDEATTSQAVFHYTPDDGIHDVWVRVTDDEGAYTLSEFITINAESQPYGAGEGLRADYYANSQLTGTPAYSETVKTIGGDWFHIDPAPGVSRSSFSIRYQGKFRPRKSGTHQFTIQSHGGIRFWLGGRLYLDSSVDPLGHTAQYLTFNEELVANEAQEVIIEYLEENGLAHLDCLIQGPDYSSDDALFPALLYLPEQNPAALGIDTPTQIARRFLGQKMRYRFQLLNSPADKDTEIWTLSSGSLPLGLSLAANGDLRGTLRSLGAFTFTIRATLRDGSFTERSCIMTVIDKRIAAPKISVKEPLSVFRTDQAAPVKASGIVSTARAVKCIYYSINNGLRHRLQGSRKWSFIIPVEMGLKGGPNEIRLMAEDEDGRVSEEVYHAFNRQYPATLIVGLSGAGTLSPGFLGITQKLVGKQYRINANPAPGYMFSHWSGGLNSESAELLFTMQEDLELYANFVPSPFRLIADSYTSLLTNETNQSQNTRSRIRLSLTADGGVSGVMDYTSLRFAFAGQFSAAGIVNLSCHEAKYGRYMGLTLQLDSETGQITAMTDVWIDWSPVSLRGELIKNQTATSAETGRWNMLLPPAENSPQGHGYLTLQVGSSGSIRVAGRLPTGRTFTDAANFTEEKSAHLYAALGYDPRSTRSESVSGTAYFPSGRNTLIGATYLWAAANGPGQIGSDLFRHEIISDGSRWVPLTAGQPFLPNSPLNLILRNGVTETTLSHPLNLGTATTYTIRPSSGEIIVLKVNRTTGSVLGDLTLPAQNGKPRRTLKIQALAHPAASRIGGYYREKDGTVGNLEAAQTR